MCLYRLTWNYIRSHGYEFCRWHMSITDLPGCIPLHSAGIVLFPGVSAGEAKVAPAAPELPEGPETGRLAYFLALLIAVSQELPARKCCQVLPSSQVL
jgi:hypothetical protein